MAASERIDVLAFLDGETRRANPEHAQAAREAHAVVVELAEALRQSNEAMALARSRWSTYPSPAQVPAAEAIKAATARNNAILARVQVGA
jgi:hypothetical protein